MGGESFFKIFSLTILSLLFISVVASANKDVKKNSANNSTKIFSHINLAAQVNAFNNDPKQMPPETNAEDTQVAEKPLPKTNQ